MEKSKILTFVKTPIKKVILSTLRDSFIFDTLDGLW